MKTKHIAAAVLVALAGIGNAMAAGHTARLTETFYSGAIFDGVVTFNDSYDAVLSIDGMLSGGGQSHPGGLDYNTRINTIFSSTPVSGGVTSAELLDGVLGSGATVSLTFAWNYSVAPSLTLSADGTYNDGYGGYGSYGNYLQPFWASNPNDVDRAISGSLTMLKESVAAVPEPSTYGMLLAGLGLLGFMARRNRRARSL